MGVCNGVSDSATLAAATIRTESHACVEQLFPALLDSESSTTIEASSGQILLPKTSQDDPLCETVRLEALP